jgi:hypothetical protein
LDRLFGSNPICTVMEERLCPKCKCHKPVTEFYGRPDRRGKVQSYCKQCFNQYCKIRWVKTKTKAIEYKGGQCADCLRKLDAENPYYLFDFHHINPAEKEYEWRKLRMFKWERIVKELDKCKCLCAVCHRHEEYREEMVLLVGLEPTTNNLEGCCSSS